MLAIGRGLMAKPVLLMMDEPSLGLAPLSYNEIFRIIGDLNQRGQRSSCGTECKKALQLPPGYVLELEGSLGSPSSEF